jgi:hypothetical protein
MSDLDVLCTHCQVAMTSWAAPGSPIRYYQCPFCARTHASCYREAFRPGAGARVALPQARAGAPEALPRASDDEIRWAGVKARAARWFARLEAEEQGLSASGPAHPPPPRQAAPRATSAAVAARPARHR